MHIYTIVSKMTSIIVGIYMNKCKIIFMMPMGEWMVVRGLEGLLSS